MALASVTQALSERRVAKFLLSDDTQTSVSPLVVGASLALAIAVIHLQDQGGLPGSQSPVWLKYGYYMVEISSTISAGLIIRGKTLGWLLGLASSVGPMTGYVMSRTTGLPGDSHDVGNWGYLLGTVSLIVEGSFIVLAVICLRRIGRAWQPNSDDVVYNWAGSGANASQVVRTAHSPAVWSTLQIAPCAIDR